MEDAISNERYARLLQKQHSIAAANTFRIYERPLEIYKRCRFVLGDDIPPIARFRSPIRLEMYSCDDVRTVNAIFYGAIT